MVTSYVCLRTHTSATISSSNGVIKFEAKIHLIEELM